MRLFKKDMEYWFVENGFTITSSKHFWIKVLGLLVLNPGVSAVFWHRVARVIYLKGPAFLTLSRIVDRWTEFLTGAQLPGESDIGVGLRVYHPNGLVVSPKSRLGERVALHSDVVLGVRDGDWLVEFPVIGDDVSLGTGAKLLGAITIGDRSIVGANAVVMKDVPADHIAVGIPAKIIPQKKPEAEPAATAESMADGAAEPAKTN
ncbi:MAG: hypothetical protein WAO61_00500 [Solirubrobacterales bacterium]